MKLSELKIKNFRCCRNVELQLGSMHALVGANNAGKSTILHALNFLFNPTSSSLNEESFSDGDTEKQIRVEAIFTDLSNEESEALAAYLKPDGSFHMARTASIKQDQKAGEDTGKFAISQEFNKPQPKFEWLVDSNIDGKNIGTWKKEKDNLVANGKSFWEFLDGKPSVGVWKGKAKEFADQHLEDSDFTETWNRNPMGYSGVLKGTLPHFELIPAVRDIADESKVLKTNPFGRLIYEIVNNLQETLRGDISKKLRETTWHLNREAEDEREEGIAGIESSMKSYLAELMPSDLEIQFQTPTIETLLTTPKIFVDDGFRGTVEGKGHGLQRAVIFSILRTYAKLMTDKKGNHKRTLILAMEEPELYMHPTAQRTIRRVLREIADLGDQVIFTTHSPLMVDVSYFDEIIRVESASESKRQAVGATESSSRVYQLPMAKMVNDLKSRYRKAKVTEDSLRERYGHAYTPTRNEGFFAKKIILAEGQTEGYCLPIYARGLGVELDSLGIAVIDCGGKDQIDRLYRIFNELGIPCYVLFDFDTGNKDENVSKASKSLLQFLKHPEHPLDGPIIEKHFACFFRDWERDLKDEIEDFEELVSAATVALGQCGKPLKARFVASMLTRETPPRVPETIEKILKKAAEVEHGGTCLSTAEQPIA